MSRSSGRCGVSLRSARVACFACWVVARLVARGRAAAVVGLANLGLASFVWPADLSGPISILGTATSGFGPLPLLAQPLTASKKRRDAR